jgi:hypothetical protein
MDPCPGNPRDAHAQLEPEVTRGTLIRDVIVVHYEFMVASSFMTGIGLNGEDYGGTFSWTMGFNAVMRVYTVASLLTIPFSWYCIQEVKNERAQTPILPFLYDVFQHATPRSACALASSLTVTASNTTGPRWNRSTRV